LSTLIIADRVDKSPPSSSSSFLVHFSRRLVRVWSAWAAGGRREAHHHHPHLLCYHRPGRHQPSSDSGSEDYVPSPAGGADPFASPAPPPALLPVPQPPPPALATACSWQPSSRGSASTPRAPYAAAPSQATAPLFAPSSNSPATRVVQLTGHALSAVDDRLLAQTLRAAVVMEREWRRPTGELSGRGAALLVAISATPSEWIAG
jgi:hypothetical protein